LGILRLVDEAVSVLVKSLEEGGGSWEFGLGDFAVFIGVASLDEL